MPKSSYAADPIAKHTFGTWRHQGSTEGSWGSSKIRRMKLWCPLMSAMAPSSSCRNGSLEYTSKLTKFPFVGERSFRFMSMTDDMNDVTDTVRNPTSPPLPNHRPGGRSPSRRGTRTSSPLLPRRSSPLASTTGAGRSRSSGKSRYSRQPRSVRESFNRIICHLPP